MGGERAGETQRRCSDLRRVVAHGRSSNENLRVGRATLESDGEHTWLESDAPPSHPALLAPTDGPLPPAEAYKWDLCGHLVLRGVMDPAWIADALHAIDSNPNPDHPSAEGEARPLANRSR